MTAEKVDLYVEQGATFSLGFVWSHEVLPATVPPTAGVPHWVSATGITARMQFRNFVTSPVMIEATTENGRITLSANGRVDVVLTDADTSTLTLPTAVYDLEVVFVGGQVGRVLQGSVTIDPNVTRAEP